MRRVYLKAYSPAVSKDMEMLVFGHHGRPLLIFPSGGGRFFDFENHGMIDSVADMIEAGKVKLYCVDGLDHESWLRQDIDPHWRAIRHNAYQDYILHDALRLIYQDCHKNYLGGTINDNFSNHLGDYLAIGLAGCSLGGYHAVNFALKFPQLFPYSLSMSGRYDLEAIGAYSDSQEVYFNNPVAYVANLQGDTLENLKKYAHLVLVCGQGAYEDKCLAETHRLADLLGIKGIRYERDIWGTDVEHHWNWWRKQFPYHVGKHLRGLEPSP